MTACCRDIIDGAARVFRDGHGGGLLCVPANPCAVPVCPCVFPDQIVKRCSGCVTLRTAKRVRGYQVRAGGGAEWNTIGDSIAVKLISGNYCVACGT